MSNVSLNRAGTRPAGPRPTGPASKGETGDIRSAEITKSFAVGDIDNEQAGDLKGAANFSASLEGEHVSRQSAMGPITQQLGPSLTFANPVWSGDPVPGMRSLQKKLIEHSLALPPEERSTCLQAISVVEGAVRLRLRLQQMSMDDLNTNAGAVEAEK